MDKLTDLKDKLFPGSNKYVSNLSGASLQDLLRAATAKTLTEPDEQINLQVVQVINEEATFPSAIKDIVGLLKARCKQDNPQKQYLAVMLIGRVLSSCAALEPSRDELLAEVAKIMYRPAAESTPITIKAKTAARELLRSYGRSGVEAVRSATIQGRAAIPPPGARTAGGNANAIDATTMRQSIIDEVHRMVEQAKGHTELLSECLLGEGVQDEFNRELVTELVNDIKELKTMFTQYLEQLSTMSDNAEVEVAMMQALEAVDMLDNSLSLEKDVQSNKDLAPLATRAPPAATQATADLISLDDFSDAHHAAQSGAPAPPTSTSYAPPPAYAGNPNPMFPTGPAQPYGQPPAYYQPPAQSQAGFPPQQPAYGQPQQYYQPQAAAYPGAYAQPPTAYGQVPATQAAPPAYAQAAPPVPPPVLPPSNPFSGLAAAPPPVAAPAPAAVAPPAAAAKVDAEWEMFFADRVQPAAATPAAAAKQDDSLI